jgi:hypothetical protein
MRSNLSHLQLRGQQRIFTAFPQLSLSKNYGNYTESGTVVNKIIMARCTIPFRIPIYRFSAPSGGAYGQSQSGVSYSVNPADPGKKLRRLI